MARLAPLLRLRDTKRNADVELVLRQAALFSHDDVLAQGFLECSTDDRCSHRRGLDVAYFDIEPADGPKGDAALTLGTPTRLQEDLRQPLGKHVGFGIGWSDDRDGTG